MNELDPAKDPINDHYEWYGEIIPSVSMRLYNTVDITTTGGCMLQRGMLILQTHTHKEELVSIPALFAQRGFAFCKGLEEGFTQILVCQMRNVHLMDPHRAPSPNCVLAHKLSWLITHEEVEQLK